MKPNERRKSRMTVSFRSQNGKNRHRTSCSRKPRYATSQHVIGSIKDLLNLPGRRYGAYLSKEQVAELVAPRPGTLEFINPWLRYHGVSSSSVSMTHGGTMLTVNDVSVIRVNALLGASYQLYGHVKTNKTIVRAVGYALPAAPHGVVQIWQSPRKRSGGAAADVVKQASGEPVIVLSSRDDDVSHPSFLHSLYKTVGYTPAATNLNRLGVLGITGDYPRPEDLAVFMYSYRSNGPDAAFTVVRVNGGGYDPSHPTQSRTLTSSTLRASWGIRPQSSSTTQAFLSWLGFIINQRNIPQAISSSYVSNENICSREYSMYLCALFTLLAACGISVLVASRDDDVDPGDCLTMHRRGCGSLTPPYFPRSLCHCRRVGGTTDTPEVAASFSGGGFSNYHKPPNYQVEAHHGLYNASGRGFLDIAAQPRKFPFFINGEQQIASGTSTSAPIVAGTISLLNDCLISQGRAPLGFLNPWLYVTGFASLTDITTGSNPGCNTNGSPAIDGWDPVGTAKLGPSISTMAD
ncbi:subtilisin-like protein [Lactarius psammicola]|nr:subtilisin-like protein [Lactarius psammicola]